jgi:hypothetical protein
LTFNVVPTGLSTRPTLWGTHEKCDSTREVIWTMVKRCKKLDYTHILGDVYWIIHIIYIYIYTY